MTARLKTVPLLLKRLGVLSLVVIGFFILTQDLQVFPCLLSSRRGAPIVAPPFVEESRVVTADEESIIVWRVAAEGDRKGVVVFLHGNGETRASGVVLQQILARHGLTSYSFDYRGVAGSSGWPTQEGIYRDGEAVVEFAQREEIKRAAKHEGIQFPAHRRGIEPSELIIMGVSIGTGPAAYLAQRYHAAAVALVSPYFRFDTLVSEMPLFGYLTPFLKYSFPTVDHLKATSKTRIIIAHGTIDNIIPYAHTERIKAALGESHNPQILRFEGYGHNNILSVAIEPIVRAILGSNEKSGIDT